MKLSKKDKEQFKAYLMNLGELNSLEFLGFFVHIQKGEKRFSVHSEDLLSIGGAGSQLFLERLGELNQLQSIEQVINDFEYRIVHSDSNITIGTVGGEPASWEGAFSFPEDPHSIRFWDEGERTIMSPFTFRVRGGKWIEVQDEEEDSPFASW